MNILAAKREHFPTWLRLRSALYTGLDEDFHLREMQWILDADHLSAFLALTREGDPIGLLELSLRNVVDGCIGTPVGYIEGVYLMPAYRGRGWGKQLLAFAEEWFRSRGCRDVATDAEVENDQAQRFDRGVGFHRTSTVAQFRKSLG